MPIVAEDWSAVPAERVAPLFAADVARWADELAWDAQPLCREIERGRRLGTVSGVLLSEPGGGIVGWTYYLEHRSSLLVGGFVSKDESTTRRLIDVVLEAADARRSLSCGLFVLAGAAGLQPELCRRGFATARYIYLARPLAPPARRAEAGFPPWTSAFLAPAAHLMARAYPGPDESRPFAPRGALAEWIEYAEQLTSGDGCGRLLAAASPVALGPRGAIDGVALTTRIAPETAHLVQLAVDPDRQAKGLGAALLNRAAEVAWDLGCRWMTLLVSADNAAARRLYARAGFEEAAHFVAAGSFQPRRLIRFAEGSGVSALR